MASEYCVHKSTDLIPDYDFLVPTELLGEQVYYYRNCYYLRDFISECNLSERYYCNDIVRIVPRHAKELVSELENYINSNEIPSKDLVEMNNFLNLLKEISEDNTYMYYLDYCD